MKKKEEILGKLLLFTNDLTGENLALANVAMLETEVQIDIRDILSNNLSQLINPLNVIANRE